MYQGELKEVKVENIKAVFKDRIDKQKIVKLLRIYNTVSENNWNYFGVHTFQETEDWVELFFCIKQATFESLTFNQNPHPLLLKSLASIKFRQLGYLNLSGCKLSDVETIAFFDAERLKVLDLSCNIITSFKFFDKIMFPELKSLNVTDNFAWIQTTVRFNSKRIESFLAQSHFTKTDLKIDYKILVKSQAAKLKHYSYQ